MRTDRAYRPRAKRGSLALRSAAESISYEYEMFMAATSCLLTIDPSDNRPEVQALRNMALESSLIHARNIRDFFSPNGRNDDIIARDFVTPMPRISMPYLRKKTTARRINRLLAHPSYGRSRLTRGWEIGTLRQEIATAWKLFLAGLAEKKPGRRGYFP